VINRGNAQQDVFHKDEDFDAFVKLIGEASERLPMRVLSYCIMTNHFHLALWPHEDGDLSRWMQWFLTSHVRRYHRHYGGSGHVWQGRFKAFPIQRNEHLCTVLRYIERNPVRANLVTRAEEWQWSSARLWLPGATSNLVHKSPVPRGDNWLQRVNQPQTEAEVVALRHSVDRGTPFGSKHWITRTANALGLESTTRPRGRPKKSK